MTDEELIARLRSSSRHPMMDNNCKVDVFLVNDAADRIEAMTEQLAAARQDAKEAEAYAEELENEAVLSKAAYEGVSSLLLSVQQDCIKERQRAERLEAKLAENEVRLRKAVEALEEIFGNGNAAGRNPQLMADKARATLAAVSETHKIKGSKAATPCGLKGESHE